MYVVEVTAPSIVLLVIITELDLVFRERFLLDNYSQIWVKFRINDVSVA